MEFILLDRPDIQGLAQLQSDLSKTTIIGLDTETSSLDVFSARFLLLQLNINNKIYIIDPTGIGNDNLKYIISLIKDSNKTCVGHNIKFDIKVLKKNTGIILTKVFDTMVVENVIRAGLGDNFPSLADLARNYVGVVLEKDTRNKFIDAYAVTQDMLIYSALDVKYLLDIYNAQRNLLELHKLEEVANLENKLVPAVADMEYNGIRIDVNLWKQLNDTAEKKVNDLRMEIIDKIATKVSELSKNENALDVINLLKITVKTQKEKNTLGLLTGKESIYNSIKKYFNLNSNQQVQTVLQYIGIPVNSNRSDDLEKLKNESPLIEKILEYKYYYKRLESFGNDFIQKINPITNRLHANFNQIGTATGRWSSDNPNLQQIPRKEENNDNSRYRDCFIASAGYKLLTVDYDQAELRLLGAVSGEEEFIKAYNNNIDIHTLTATHIFHKSLEEVTKDERWVAKQVNFAIVYGSTEYGLNYNFGIPIDEAREHLNNFFLAYPRIKNFMRMAGEKIWELKYSITPFGRKRFFEDKVLFNDPKEYYKYKNSVIRKGNNHIIQGGSADILKLAFVDIYYNNPFGDGLKILMSVHDEGVFEISEDIIDEAIPFVIKKMEENEQRFLGPIPAAVDYKIGNTWSK